MLKLIRPKKSRALINPETDLLSVGAKYVISDFIETNPHLLTNEQAFLIQVNTHLSNEGFDLKNEKSFREIKRYYKKLRNYFT